MQTAASFSEYTRQRLERRLGIVSGLIILLIFALLTAAILKSRRDAAAKARLEASYIAATLSEDFGGALGTISCASDFIKERIEAGGVIDFLPKLQQQVSRSAPGLTAISLIGADGKMTVSSASGPSDAPDFSNADFFRSQKYSDDNSLKIGKPLTIAGRTIIPASRRIEPKDGAFSGVVLFSLDPQIGTETYRKVNLGATGAIKIVGTNGTIFAGHTNTRGYDPTLIGTSFPEKGLVSWRIANAGTFTVTSPYDGIERIYYWRRIRGYPLLAVVGLGRSEALTGARREALLIGTLATLSALLLLLMTLMLKREFARRTRQALSLDSHRRKLRETNAKLRTAKKQAEEASQSKSLFLANISHELRTPLNAILGFAEIIRDRIFGNDIKRYSSYASDIHDAGLHLLNIVGSLLDLSKIEAGQFELHESSIQVGEVMRESVRVVGSQAAVRDVALSVSEESTPATLYADATAVKQIILNLLSNAIKFTEKDGTVSLASAIESDGTLLLEVKDTGVGMTNAEIREALQPFRQIHSDLYSRPEGAGLGLPIVMRLIELHGGVLKLESNPGFGTTASVRFPAWRVCAAPGALNVEYASVPSC